MTSQVAGLTENAPTGKESLSGTELQESLAALAEQVQAIQIGAFEEDEATVASLASDITAALSEGCALLDELLRYEDEQDASDTASTDFYADVETLMSSGKGRERVASIAFISKWELANKRTRIQAVAEHGDAGNLIDECGSARRKLLKSTIALEMAMSEQEGRPSRLAPAYRSELDRAILTRRAYTDLFRAISGNEEPSGDQVEARVKHAARAIARLVLTEIYSDLRASDRRELRQLRARVTAWLTRPDQQETVTGQRLWQDIRSFSELLLQVNNRVQLIEHDESLLQATRRQLSNGELSVEKMRSVLAPVFGRDPELDQLISGGSEAAATANETTWRLVIERVLNRLNGRESGALAVSSELETSFDNEVHLRFGT